MADGVDVTQLSKINRVGCPTDEIRPVDFIARFSGVSNRRGLRMSESRDFDWHDDSEAVVVPEQAAAGFNNPFGGIVIRQCGDDYRGEDIFVVVRPENARALCAAIMRLAGQLMLMGEDGADAYGDTAAPKATGKDRTAAERARRHRERRRNAPVTDESSAKRNGRVTAGSATRHANVTALAPMERQQELLEAAE